MTIDIGWNLGIILSMIVLTVKYIADYTKTKAKIDQNRELFDLHCKDNKEEHIKIFTDNKEIMNKLEEINKNLVKLFERMPKREADNDN